MLVVRVKECENESQIGGMGSLVDRFSGCLAAAVRAGTERCFTDEVHRPLPAFVEWFYVSVRFVIADDGMKGGALGGGTNSGGAGFLASVGRRWARILSMTSCSSMQAMTLIGPRQRGQVLMSM